MSDRNRRSYCVAARLGGGVALAILVGAPMQPNPPAPNTAKASQPSRQMAPSDSRNAQSDDRGSPQRPLVVQTVSAPKSEKESAQDAEDRTEKRSSDWWLVRLTGALVVVGLLQAYVFGLQARRLKDTITKMDEVASGQSDEMRKYISQAVRTAAAMERLGTFTNQQVGVQHKQADAMSKTLDQTRRAAEASARAATAMESMSRAMSTQAALSEKALFGLERPRIYAFGLKPVQTDPNDCGSVRALTYFVANFGRNAAIIETVETGATNEVEFAGGRVIALASRARITRC